MPSGAASAFLFRLMLIPVVSTALTEIALTILALAAFAAVLHAALARQRRLEPGPKHGPLACNTCTTIVAGDVCYVGQNLTCPRCGCNVRAPGIPHRSPAISTRAAIALAIGLAIVLLVLGRM